MVKTVWKAQQEPTECQTLNQKIIETGEYKISPTASFKIMDELIYRVVKLTAQDPVSSLHTKQLSVAVTGVLPPRSRDFFLALNIGTISTVRCEF